MTSLGYNKVGMRRPFKPTSRNAAAINLHPSPFDPSAGSERALLLVHNDQVYSFTVADIHKIVLLDFLDIDPYILRRYKTHPGEVVICA